MPGEDTIAAISTAQGTGGIGIIRISGEKAFYIADGIFKGKKPFDAIRSHSITFGKIIDPQNGEKIDEVLISKMKKPNTFTRENIVEINCHGGLTVIRKILELVVKQGARLAEPGEFTKRAFLNGRIDLSQAEAVIDLINSKTFESSKAALSQLEGKLSEKIKAARNRLIELIAHIEVTIDYPEHDIEEITGKMVYDEIKDVRYNLTQIVKDFERGKVIREGVNVVITGRPNVGKSSLLNGLVGKNKAIVTDIPGTTRDIIEEYININGIPVRLIDTAGMRETEDEVERIGVERAERALEHADLVLMLLDSSEGINEEDFKILGKIGDTRAIILLNKVDMGNKINGSLLPSEIKKIRISVKEGIGMDELEEAIIGLIIKGGINTGNEVLVTNIRHKSLIDKAISDINEACGSYECSMPLDCITIDIKNAAESLGQITGESVSEDVMQSIFSKFCIGK